MKRQFSVQYYRRMWQAYKIIFSMQKRSFCVHLSAICRCISIQFPSLQVVNTILKCLYNMIYFTVHAIPLYSLLSILAIATLQLAVHSWHGLTTPKLPKGSPGEGFMEVCHKEI